MAKKKTTKKRPKRPTKTVASGKVAQVKQPGGRKKAVKKKTTAREEDREGDGRNQDGAFAHG